MSAALIAPRALASTTFKEKSCPAYNPKLLQVIVRRLAHGRCTTQRFPDIVLNAEREQETRGLEYCRSAMIWAEDEPDWELEWLGRFSRVGPKAV